MIEAIYEGILLGLVLAFSFGPAFFALINTGIAHGYKTGSFLAFGILFSDIFLVGLSFSLIYLGASHVLSNPKNQYFIGVIGGIVLIIYGVFNFLQKTPKSDNENIEIKAPNAVVMVVKGFFLNLFNPFVWIFWLATTTAVSSKFEFSWFRIAVFFCSTLSVVISTDLLKTFVAGKIKKFLTHKIMRKVNIISGIILITFGLYLIYKVFFLQK